MLQYLLRRVLFLGLTFVLTSIIIFGISQVLPGDVARVLLGREAGEEAVQTLRVQLGLNDPLPTRYVHWISDFVRGDWGVSYSNNERPIYPLVMERLRHSVWLAGVALVVSVPIAIALGLFAGLNANKPVDGAISISSLALVGLPEFVTGVILINILAFQWHVFPASSFSIGPDTTFPEALPYMLGS